MLYRVPHFSGTRLQHQGPYSSSSSASPPDGVCTIRAIDRPLSAHTNAAAPLLFFLTFFYYFIRVVSSPESFTTFGSSLTVPYSAIKQTHNNNNNTFDPIG